MPYEASSEQKQMRREQTASMRINSDNNALVKKKDQGAENLVRDGMDMTTEHSIAKN